MSTAAGWERWADWLERQQRDVVDWLCREARIAAGMTVLDVASGAGQPALEAARRVGPEGRVIATDADASLLAGCERRASARGLCNVEARALDMHELRGVPDGSVDAVTCGFALMFSPEPARVLGEIRRVLRAGGRVALCVWDEPARNPFFTSMFGALAQVAPMKPPEPGAPGPFGLSRPGALEDLMVSAGFGDVRVEPVPFVFDFDSVEQHWEINSELAAPLKRAAATLPAADLERLRAALAAALEPHTSGGRVRVTGTPLCATGQR